MRKVVKIENPEENDLERNKRIKKVIGKIIAIIIAMGLMAYLFTLPVEGKELLDNQNDLEEELAKHSLVIAQMDNIPEMYNIMNGKVKRLNNKKDYFK